MNFTKQLSLEHLETTSSVWQSLKKDLFGFYKLIQEAYLGLYKTSMMVLFGRKQSTVLRIIYFCKKVTALI